MSTLRRALGDGQEGERFIQTVPTRGYRFVAAVSKVEEKRPDGAWRFGVWMFSLFCRVCLRAGDGGLFSLVSLDVAQRRHEFAVRLALGARPRDVLWTVLLRAGWRVLAGITLGALVAIAGTRALGSLLFGVDALDMTTYVAVIVAVSLVVAVASYLPARRAAGIEPLALLRRE